MHIIPYTLQHLPMSDEVEEHEGTVSIAGRTITNLRFAGDIDGLAGSEQELAQLVERIDQTSKAYGMEINAEKTKLMTNNINGIHKEIKASDHKLQTVTNFKYLGAIIYRMQDPKPKFCQEFPNALYHNDKMVRSEHHTQIQSQTNAHPRHIHPPLCLRDLDANYRITEEDQSRGNEMLPPPFAHFIQRPHHK